MSMPPLYQIGKVNSRHLFTELGISLIGKCSQYSGMTNAEIRRDNARQLAQECGGPARFAELLEMSPSQVSQIIGENPTKNIGNSIARRVEEAFSKPKGWLDRAHGETTAEATAVATELFEKVAQDYIKAEDLIALVSLFRDSTPKGRQFIMNAASRAEKTIAVSARRATKD